MTRSMNAGAVLALIVLAFGWAVAAEYPDNAPWAAPIGVAHADTVCSHASHRDTIYADTLGLRSVYEWTLDCPADDNDVGVWVWWLHAIDKATESDSMLVRQNTSITRLVPVTEWYVRGANASADSAVRYQLIADGNIPR